MLPPTRASLLPHVLRLNYMTMRDRSYVQAMPIIPPLEENEWKSENNVSCLSLVFLPSPKAVIKLDRIAEIIIELVKCGCKVGR